MCKRMNLLSVGPAPEEAPLTILYVHGRGATAHSILSLHEELGYQNISGLAPQAPGNTWYPHSFLSPIDQNEPYLSSSLSLLKSVVSDLNDKGVVSERLALVGFSQGACLTLEFIARNPEPYAFLGGLTGGLIGPPGTKRDYKGTLPGTPVLLSSGDPDPHVPFARVLETKEVLTKMGARVTVRRYPGRPHIVSEEDVADLKSLVKEVLERE